MDEATAKMLYGTARTCSILFMLLQPASVHASVTEFLDRLAGFASQVPRAPGATAQSSERRLILNGQPLRLVTGHGSASVAETLRFYHQRFESQATAPQRGMRLVGVQRVSADSGYLAMVAPESKDALVAVAEGRRSLLSTGPLRMVHAQRRAGGTDYLVLWTDAPMADAVLRASPAGDMPGQDLPAVPRPDGGVRGLSLVEPAARYALISYRLTGTPESALDAARTRLRSAGFVEDAALESTAAETPAALSQFQKKGSTVLVQSRPGQQNSSEVTYLWHAQ